MARIVTLYIEDRDIKLLVTSGKRVENWARLLLEPGLVSDGVILDEDLAAERLKELLKLQGIKAREVIVGLSGLNSLFRVISLPLLPKDILHEAVMNEARRVIPVPLNEVYLSYQRLPALGEETRLFLVAFPRNSTDALIRTTQKANLNPYIMDLAPLSLCRSVDVPRAIIINAWLTNLDVIVMADKIPQLIRSLSLPTEAASLEEKLPTIAEEFNRTVTFYNSSHKEQPLDSSVPVFVCGDLAGAPDSWQSLVGALASPVSLLPSPLEFPEAFDPSQFMVNIGLALKELLPKKGETAYSLVNFNALPEVYRPPAISLVRILTPIGIAIGIGALAYGGFFVHNSMKETEALRSQVLSIENDIVAQSSQTATLRGQVSLIGAQVVPIETTSQALNATLTSLERGHDDANSDFRAAVILAPANINVTAVNFNGGSVTVSGVAPDEDDIFSYARALRASNRYSMVIISSITEEFRQEAGEEVKVFSFGFLLK